MSPSEIHDLIENIVMELEAGADLASTIAPGIIPFIVIGKAVDKVVPDLAKIVTSWIEGNPPTPEEKDDLKRKLAVLNNPDLP